MTMSGRRPNDRLNRIGKGLIEGLSAIGTALADGPKVSRILEIDRQVAELLQERDHLVKDLIEPGDFVVSENYDPNWRKPKVEEPEDKNAMDAIFGEKQDAGRLTTCKGRWSVNSQFHDAHPGCPYIDTVHNKHEFTLRD